MAAGHSMRPPPPPPPLPPPEPPPDDEEEDASLTVMFSVTVSLAELVSLAAVPTMVLVNVPARLKRSAMSTLSVIPASRALK
mgnify:CR=1 FL=1